MSKPIAGVPTDSTNERQHRGQIASAVNTLMQRLFTASPVAKATVTGDASVTLSVKGNAVIISGSINVAAAATSFTLTRNGTTIATFDNSVSAKTLPFSWIDVPGTGSFTYATASGSHTNSATINAVEIK